MFLFLPKILKMKNIYAFLIIFVTHQFILSAIAQPYTVTLESDPPGVAFILTGEGQYQEGEEVEVVAHGYEGWVFQHWTEDGEIVSESNNYIFEITSDRHLVAHFENHVSLSSIPGSLNFGDVPVGECRYKEYLLRNNPPETKFLVDLEIIAPEGFKTAHSASYPGFTDFNDTTYHTFYYFYGEHFTVQFCPVEEKDYSGYILNIHTTADTLYLPVSGTGLGVTPTTYTVTLDSDPPEGAEQLLGAGTYEHGQEVTIAAIPGFGYTFSHWSLDGEYFSGSSTSTFIIDSDLNLTAHFSEHTPAMIVTPAEVDFGEVPLGECYISSYTLSISPQKQLGQVIISSPEDFQIRFRDQVGEFFQILVLDYFGGNLQREIDIRFCPEQEREYTGTITHEYPGADILFLPVSGSGAQVQVFSINLSASPAEAADFLYGEGNYAQGSQVTVSTAPRPGWMFLNWTENGVVVSETPSFSFTIEADRRFTANFTAAERFQLTLTADPPQGGDVEGDGRFFEGQQVTIAAEAAEGYEFDYWAGDNWIFQDTTQSVRSFRMPASDIHLVAVFEQVTSLAEIKHQEVNIYPNPAKGQLWIELNNNNVTAISLLTLKGERLQHHILNQSGFIKFSLKLTGITPGVYLLNISSGENSQVFRVVIQ
jgi:hypothetical protein